MHRLLIVEDEKPLRRTLAISLAARGYKVDEAGTGAEALALLHRTSPDLLLVDLGLPDMDGLTLVDTVRTSSRVPVIVLSARSKQSQKVDALEGGADDYVTKPFGLEELVARIRVAIRRTERRSATHLVTAAFTLDFEARRATKQGQAVRLTPTEWRLTEALVQRPRTLVTTTDLLGQVWGPHSVRQTHYLRVYFGHLRRKLEDDPAHPKHFITVPGEGYRFDP